MLARGVQRSFAESKGLQLLARVGGAAHLNYAERGVALGTAGFRRGPKGSAADDKATSAVQPVPSSPTDSLAASTKHEDEWTPIQHKSGKVYYWNKSTGRTSHAAFLVLRGIVLRARHGCAASVQG